MLFCAPIIGLWYWCTDQYIVQRALGAPNEQEARRGSIFAAFLKLLPVFIFIIPGMICFALAKPGRMRAFQGMLGGRERPCAERVPGGISADGQARLAGRRSRARRGRAAVGADEFAGGRVQRLVDAVHDGPVPEVRPTASQHELVWIGRVATMAMVLIGLAWIPVIQGARGLYDYLQGVQGYLAPPIFVVFFLGVFNKRLNAKGCLAALIVGFLLGVFRLAVDTPVRLQLAGFEKGYAEGSFLWIVNNIYFQYYSVLIFVVCLVVMIVVSYATKPPQIERLSGLTYGTTTDDDRARSRASWSWADVAASAVVLLAILAAYLYFNG